MPACYLTLGKLAPEFEAVELRLGGSTVAAAITEATGVSRAQLGRLHDTLGDLGDVAEQCRIKQANPPPPPPTPFFTCTSSLNFGSVVSNRPSSVAVPLLAAVEKSVGPLLFVCHDSPANWCWHIPESGSSTNLEHSQEALRRLSSVPGFQQRCPMMHWVSRLTATLYIAGDRWCCS